MTLADVLKLAWEAGRNGRKPEQAVEELEGLAVGKRVRVFTPEEWRLRLARKKYEQLRGKGLSVRRMAALCKVDRRTIRDWEKTGGTSERLNSHGGELIIRVRGESQ